MSDRPADDPVVDGLEDDDSRTITNLNRAVIQAPLFAFFTIADTRPIADIVLFVFDVPSELYSLPRMWRPLLAAGLTVHIISSRIISIFT